MGLRSWFRRKPKEEAASMGMQGQPVQVISGPSPHPDHYDKERNTARITQLEAAIEQFFESGQGNHPMVAHLKEELAKHRKIREIFHSGEEA
jgi:hypothetical protein